MSLLRKAFARKPPGPPAWANPRHYQDMRGYAFCLMEHHVPTDLAIELLAKAKSYFEAVEAEPDQFERMEAGHAWRLESQREGHAAAADTLLRKIGYRAPEEVKTAGLPLSFSTAPDGTPLESTKDPRWGPWGNNG
jgi:hypothetical protein